jgi:hypothetical protein
MTCICIRPMPAVSAIALTLSTPSLVSICTITRMFSFADVTYSEALIPQLAGANGLPSPRLPTGGNRLSATISFAFSAVETWVTRVCQVSHATTDDKQGAYHRNQDTPGTCI